MDGNCIQPPRFTSTPRANRNTFTLLNNFNEVSPIFSTEDNGRRSKSVIPVAIPNNIRTNGVRSNGTRTKVSMSTNSSGSGSSSSVQIPSQIPKLDAAKKIVSDQGKAKSRGSFLARDLQKKNMVKTLEKVSLKSASVISDPVPKVAEPQATPGDCGDKVSTKRVTVTKSQVPEKEPRNSVDEVPTKRGSLNRSLVPKAVSERETPRNSVDEVIDSVVGSQSKKETKISTQDTNAKGPLKTTTLPSFSNVAQTLRTAAKATNEDSRIASHRISKVSLRQSTLPSVPEEGSNEDNVQPSGECILKKSDKTQSGWLIPKETKNPASLKRKSSVPPTVTKRNRTTAVDVEQNDESLFDSPDFPNIDNVPSVCNKRQTYIVKKKPEMTNMQDQRQGCITDGIIPLQFLSPESPLTSTNIKHGLGDSKNKRKESKIRETVNNVDQSKNKSEEMNYGKENYDHERDVSTNIKDVKNKNKLNRQSKKQLKENVQAGSTNGMTEVAESKLTECAKPTESNEEPGQKKKESSSSVKILKERSVNNNDNQSEETIKKSKRMEKKETKPNEDLITESAESETVLKRKLRARKPNLKYNDMSGLNHSKEFPSKSKKERLVQAKEHKDKPQESSYGIKGQKKKTVKGKKNQICMDSDSDELPLSQVKVSSEFDIVNTSNKSKCHKSKRIVEKESADRENDNGEKNTLINAKTGAENKKKQKKATAKCSEIPAEKKEEQNTDAVQHGKSCIQAKEKCRTIAPQSCTSKTDIVVPSMSNTNGKTQLQKQVTLDAKEEEIQFNAESEKAVALSDTDNFKMASYKAGSSKSAKTTKSGSNASSETNGRRKKVLKKSTAKNTDEGNMVMNLVELSADGNSQPANVEISRDLVEKKSNRKFDVCEQPKDVPLKETRNTLTCKLSKVFDEDGCPCAENSKVSAGRKRKSEETSEASHSVTTGPKSSWKRRRHDNPHSEYVDNGEIRYNIKDLFGTAEHAAQELRPGVVAHRSIHINNFIMVGEVQLEPGAVLNKISTNTAYTVLEGTAEVRIKKHINTYSGSDVHRKFFIPRSIDVSITNVGNIPLKMDFLKFRG